MRNRTMALVAHASVAIESGETGGTIHQGWEALRLGRPLFITRQLAEDERLSWARKMLEYGATVLNRQGEVLRVLPAPRGPLDVNAF